MVAVGACAGGGGGGGSSAVGAGMGSRAASAAGENTCNRVGGKWWEFSSASEKGAAGGERGVQGSSPRPAQASKAAGPAGHKLLPPPAQGGLEALAAARAQGFASLNAKAQHHAPMAAGMKLEGEGRKGVGQLQPPPPQQGQQSQQRQETGEVVKRRAGRPSNAELQQRQLRLQQLQQQQQQQQQGQQGAGVNQQQVAVKEEAGGGAVGAPSRGNVYGNAWQERGAHSSLLQAHGAGGGGGAGRGCVSFQGKGGLGGLLPPVDMDAEPQHPQQQRQQWRQQPQDKGMTPPFQQGVGGDESLANAVQPNAEGFVLCARVAKELVEQKVCVLCFWGETQVCECEGRYLGKDVGMGVGVGVDVSGCMWVWQLWVGITLVLPLVLLRL